ncbi:unnamed protein product [Arctia plantaginis]|uniref:Uncharacterized protein n=1 Tax=Arctia plantaginis TaxID=874455 RepID=A0A8S1AN67_ARCPL|nr:unnamed protein product [Arctia plantaginis]CAB3254948.1 unnamed protein product [Arctia plantaginis]
MLAVMARGDECKTATKANYACKSLEVSAPMKKPVQQVPQYQAVKTPEQKKDYGSWGPVYKDKKSFTEMHIC